MEDPNPKGTPNEVCPSYEHSICPKQRPAYCAFATMVTFFDARLAASSFSTLLLGS